MKHINYLLICISSLFLGACTNLLETDSGLLGNTVTKADNLETMEVVLTTAGTLTDKLGEKKSTVQKLILSGPVDAEDVNLLRNGMPLLESLNIESVEFVESEKTYETPWGKFPVVKNGVGQYMFSRMNLKETILPENIEIIKYGAFESCSLETVNLPESIKTIEANAFKATNLVNVVIPSKMTELSNYVFELCEKLQSISLPEGLVKIGNSALGKCMSLQSLSLPQSLKDMGLGALGQTGLKSITIPEGVTVLPELCFDFCKELQEVNLPSHLTKIGGSTFRSCTSLQSIVIPESVTEVDEWIFNDCTALENVKLPDNLKYISRCMFYGCTALKTIKLPSKLTTIRDSGFINCSALQYLDIPETVTSIEVGVFHRNNALYAIWVRGCPTIEDAIASDANTLVYLSDPNTKMDASIKNIIINGVTTSITLNNKYDFFCPESFKTQKITYTHKFNSTNSEYPIPGKAAGWVGLSLPFNVKEIVHKDGRVLAPFNAEVVDAKPFWLRKLTNNGFENATAIEAGVPYIIAMPHNKRYDEVYNIEGDVTFMAEDVTNGIVIPETGYKKVQGAQFDFNPSYAKVDKNAATFVLNTYKEDRFEGYDYGGVFVRNLRDTKPFEAYVTGKNVAAGARTFFDIGGYVRTRSVHAIGDKPNIDDI